MTILSPADASYGILRRAVQAGALALAAALVLAGPAAARWICQSEVRIDIQKLKVSESARPFFNGNPPRMK